MGISRLLPWVLLSFSYAWGVQERDMEVPAYVTVNVAENSVQHKNRLVSPFVAEGVFSAVGTLENAEGNICLVGKDFFLNIHKPKKNQKWIGLMYHTEDETVHAAEDERDNRGNKKSDRIDHSGMKKNKSLAERMKEIFLLGASALIIVVKNVRFTKEFDVAHVFSKPVVLFHGVENVTKILQLISLHYNLFAKIQRQFPYYSAVGTIGTVTLWATCGRSTSGAYHEWQGVVCIGNNHFSNKAIDDYFTAMAWNLSFLLFICFLIYVYIMLSRNSFNEMTDLDNEVGDLNQARHALSQLRIEIYRSKGRTSAKKSKKAFVARKHRIKKFENALDHCAICLDPFFPLQRLRVLPCNHSFHITCIDKWLLAQHTCPMCKFNILDHQKLLEAESENL